MGDAFERLFAELDDLWQLIKRPFEWVIARRWLLIAYALALLVAVVVNVFMR